MIMSRNFSIDGVEEFWFKIFEFTKMMRTSASKMQTFASNDANFKDARIIFEMQTKVLKM